MHVYRSLPEVRYEIIRAEREEQERILGLIRVRKERSFREAKEAAPADESERACIALLSELERGVLQGWKR